MHTACKMVWAIPKYVVGWEQGHQFAPEIMEVGRFFDAMTESDTIDSRDVLGRRGERCVLYFPLFSVNQSTVC